MINIIYKYKEMLNSVNELLFRDMRVVITLNAMVLL